VGTPFEGRSEVRARALVLGERIDLRTLETTRRLAVGPLLLSAGANGCVALFHYGAVVLFDLAPVEEASFLDGLLAYVRQPVPTREFEEVVLRVASIETEAVDNGVIAVHEISLDRLQVVADILAKSVVLARYEASIAGVFDRIEPLADSLSRRGAAGQRSRELLSHLGGSLLVEHKMVGRAEVAEKPEILWDRPQLERLFARLEDEYEIRERHLALERKLDLVARTAQTLLDLLQNERSLRVEWYIVALIVIEILLTLYTIFAR
jgi:uncharacterized Rmd1/YagE family protein